MPPSARPVLAQFGGRQPPASSSCSRGSRRCSSWRRCSAPDRSRRACARSSRCALAIGLTPVAIARPAHADTTRSRWSRSIFKELLVGVAFALRARRAVRGGIERRRVAGHARRLLVRRARRPAHRQPVGGADAAVRARRARRLHRDRRHQLGDRAASRAPTTSSPLSAAPDVESARGRRRRELRGDLLRRARDRRAGACWRSIITDVGVRRRDARRAAAERLRGRLPGEGDRRPDC